MFYLRKTLAFKKDLTPRESSRARTSRGPLVGGAILGIAAVGLTAAGMSAGVQAASATTFWPQQYFAPYVDTDLGDASLTNLQSAYGTSYFTLAFVDGSGCQWSLPDASYWQGQVNALRARGGDVSISFGGAGIDNDRTDLGSQCSSPQAMAAQVENVVSYFGVNHLDFDIEGSAEANGDNQLTAQALAEVQTWAGNQGLPLYISYTLPATPSGLDSTGLDVLRTAYDLGFTPDVVNMMSFDYGQSGIEMGQAAEQSIDGLANQLTSVYPITISAAYEMVGVTSMIGQNDSSGEVFTLSDAQALESYAAQQGITELSMWSYNRDNGSCAGNTSASPTCSGLSQSSGQFATTFQQFTQGGGGPYVVATGQIASGIDGYCLDDFGGTGAKGVKADLWPCNQGAGQIWNYMSNGALEINGLCLDASNQGTADKTLLILWPCNGQPNQQWYQEANGELVGAQSGRCVDDPNSATANGPQQWLWDCNDTANQQWWGAA